MSEASAGPQSVAQLSGSLDARTICVLLWSGLYLWEIIRAIPLNWLILSGKRGCRWGAFVLYFPFRSLAAVSFAFAIIGVFPVQWQPKHILTLHYAGESINMIARLLVYHIITVQVASLWKNWTVSYPLVAAMLAVWAVSIYCISRIRSVWGATVMLRVFTICCLCLSTALVVLFAAGVARARAQSRFNPMHRRFGQASLWSTLYAEGAQFVLPLWLAQVVDSATKLSMGDTDALAAIGITCYIVIIVCGCRAYQHAAMRTPACPSSGVPCLLTHIMHSKAATRTSASYASRASRSHDRPAPPATPRGHAHAHAPHTGVGVGAPKAGADVHVVPPDAIELDTLSSLDALPSPTSGTTKRGLHDDASSADVLSDKGV